MFGRSGQWKKCFVSPRLTLGLLITASTVVLSSVKDNWQSLRTIGKLGNWPSRNHLTDQNQIWHEWLRSWVIQICKVWLGTDKQGRLHEYVKYTRTVTCNLSFYFYFSSIYPQIRPLNGHSRPMAQTTQICPRLCLLGVRLFKSSVWGSFSP